VTRTTSGYERRDNDLYETPEWVAAAMAEVIPLKGRIVWEPAVGPGKFARAMTALGAQVYGTDLVDYGSAAQHGLYDFSSDEPPPVRGFHGIVTNPPYGLRNKLAETFVRKALARIPCGGFVIMLLPTDFDHAKTRADLFGRCPYFAGRIVLTRRIQWFEGDSGNTQNHALFIWRIDALGQPVRPSIWYAPTEAP
jgi:hypothetical protein